MPTYNVHLYREMLLHCPGIEAGSPEQAAAIARDQPTDQAEKIHDCEGETLSALVDLPGDEEYRHSVNVYFEPERLRQAAPEMLQALQAAAHYLAEHMDASDTSALRVFQQIQAAITKGKLAQDRPDPGTD